MSVNNIIIYIMVFFMFVGAIDRVFGNKLGYGQKFKNGIMTIFYKIIGANPTMFAGTILASDMGGYILSQELATSPEGGLLSGLFLSATMGTTHSFTIPNDKSTADLIACLATIFQSLNIKNI